MFSEGYSQFLGEAQAKGRAKADGFSIENLRNLRGDERVLAEARLLDMARNGDSTAIDAIVVFDTPSVRTTLDNIVNSLQPPNATHADAAWTLWRLTGEKQYQLAMIADLEDPIAARRFVVLNHLVRTPSQPELRAALFKIVKCDADNGCRTMAAVGLLLSAGLISDVDDRPAAFNGLLRDLWSTKNVDRKRAQEQLDRLLNGEVQGGGSCFL